MALAAQTSRAWEAKTSGGSRSRVESPLAPAGDRRGPTHRTQRRLVWDGDLVIASPPLLASALAPGREGPLKAAFVPQASSRQGPIHLKTAFEKRGRASAPGAPARPRCLWDRVAGGRRTSAKHVRASDLLFLAPGWFIFVLTPPAILSLKHCVHACLHTTTTTTTSPRPLHAPSSPPLLAESGWGSEPQIPGKKDAHPYRAQTRPPMRYPSGSLRPPH